MSKGVIKGYEQMMLRRVDPVDMLTRYLNNEYTSLTIPEEKVTMASYVKMGKSLGNLPTEETYRISDNTVIGKTVITTNHSNYKYFKDKNEKNYDIVKPIQRCIHCKRVIKGEPVGIPLEMEYSNKNIRFYTDGTYCNFGCAYADLKRQLNVSRVYKDPLYMDAETMLYTMYYRMHPSKVGTRIKEAPDWRLLKENGGPLTSEQFDSQSYQYMQVPTLVTVPAKRQYIKLVIPATKSS